jgi:hypothetical protein
MQPRKVDGYTSVFATEVTPGEPGKKPVKIKLVDAKTKEVLTLFALLVQKYNLSLVIKLVDAKTKEVLTVFALLAQQYKY